MDAVLLYRIQFICLKVIQSMKATKRCLAILGMKEDVSFFALHSLVLVLETFIPQMGTSCLILPWKQEAKLELDKASLNFEK